MLPNYLSFFLILLLMTVISGCGDGKKTDANPAKELKIESEGEYLFLKVDDPASGTAEPLNDEKVIAYSYVNTGIPLEKILQLQEGDTLSLSLDENLVIEAKIQRVQNILEIHSISAKVEGEEDGQLVLTVEDKKMRGSVSLFKSSRYFQIRYHSGADSHYIAELDREKMDVLPGSPSPDIPEQN